jgi:hypothetical protein
MRKSLATIVVLLGVMTLSYGQSGPIQDVEIVIIDVTSPPHPVYVVVGGKVVSVNTQNPGGVVVPSPGPSGPDVLPPDPSSSLNPISVGAREYFQSYASSFKTVAAQIEKRQIVTVDYAGKLQEQKRKDAGVRFGKLIDTAIGPVVDNQGRFQNAAEAAKVYNMISDSISRVINGDAK